MAEHKEPKMFGNIFNVTKKAHDRMPDATGSFNVPQELIELMAKAPKNADGYVVMDFAAWTKQGPRAGNYLSGNLSLSRDPNKGNRTTVSQGSFNPKPATQNDDDSDIPF